jgi:tripartite-type tricarboxylate transporter receptor subunit TctC
MVKKLLAALVAAVVPAIAAAQAWPDKPVRLVVPFPPGGGADILGRNIGAKLQERLKQPVIIENTPGAGGILGTQKVATSPADGYTFVMGITNTFAINRTFYGKLPYDPIKDFVGVALLAVSPHILVVHPDTPGRNLAEYVDYVKANKGKLSYASYGNGSTTHLISEMFNEQFKVDLVHVPYKGMPPALTDVMGQRISMLVSSSAPAIPLIQGKKLKALAIYGPSRIDALPEVPTTGELGMKDSALTLWYGLFAPAGTPRAVVERVNAELKAIVADKDVLESLSKAALYPQPMGVDEFGAWVLAEGERWGKLVKLSGAKAE